jgi:hypothetical protein
LLFLAGWEIAWRYREDKSYLRCLAKSQREYRAYAHTAFDLKKLPEEELDLVFVMAYAKIGPQSREAQLQVHNACRDSSKTGRLLRDRIKGHLSGHKILARLSPVMKPTILSTKRSRRGLSLSECPTVLDTVPAIIPPPPRTTMNTELPLIESAHNPGHTYNLDMYTVTIPEPLLNYDIFDTDPCATDDPWNYPALCQANTTSTTRPDVTSIESGPAWTL